MTTVELTLVETVRALVAEFPQLFTLEPGLDEKEINAVEQRIGAPLPADVRQLLTSTRALCIIGAPWLEERFDDADDLRASYLRSMGEWPPHPWVISSDGGRGAWAVAVDSVTGEWGPVMYCSNLLRYEVQAGSLREYIEQFRDAARSIPKEDMEALSLSSQDEGRTGGWRPSPERQEVLDTLFDYRLLDQAPAGVLPASRARANADPIVAGLAADLDATWLVVDLRGNELKAFRLSLGERDETVPIRATPDGLIFALRMVSPDIATRVCARYPRP